MDGRAYPIGPVMDGYSVQDAASVLGVPEGRVWELLARGVLSGTPEGDSMRVYLKALPGSIATAAPRDEPQRSNGNGDSHGSGGEASAFRELLTEFRNLTERYGQALLALGEARGEVAGLRSRVDLLEARLDLRLPASLDAAPVAWESPAASARPPEQPTPARVAPVMPTPAPVRRSPRSHKARSTRAAVAGFADALARAQDPTLAAFGGAEGTEEVVLEPAVLDTEMVDERASNVVPGAGSPFEAAVGEPEAAQPTYSAAVVEPDWFADGDFAWLDAADIQARSEAEEIALAPAPLETELFAEPEPVAESVAEPEPIVETELFAEPFAEPEPVVETQPQAESVAEPEPERAEVSPPAGEEEVMWLGAEGEAALLPPTWDPLETEAWPAADAAPQVAEAARPPLAMTEEELARLAVDEGWDDAEVAAIRAMISVPAPQAVQLPGGLELDEAMAALNAVPLEADANAEPPHEWAKPTTGRDEPVAYDDWAFEAEPGPSPAPAPAPQDAARRLVADPGWLRRRRGPAASAYRRLRRLFPG
jgi:hypothetical protein